MLHKIRKNIKKLKNFTSKKVDALVISLRKKMHYKEIVLSQTNNFLHAGEL